MGTQNIYFQIHILRIWDFLIDMNVICRDLLDHYDDIVNSVARRSLLEDCYAEIVQLMGEENAPPPDYFLEVYGRTVINSFNVLDPTEQVHSIPENRLNKNAVHLLIDHWPAEWSERAVKEKAS